MPRLFCRYSGRFCVRSANALAGNRERWGVGGEGGGTCLTPPLPLSALPLRFFYSLFPTARLGIGRGSDGGACGPRLPSVPPSGIRAACS